MKLVSGHSLSAFSLALLFSITAYAQGGATSSVTGIVKDSAGGVIPGASVVVASNATGTKFEALTTSTPFTPTFRSPRLARGRLDFSGRSVEIWRWNSATSGQRV